MERILTIKDKILAYLSEKGIKKSEFFEATGIQSSNFKGKNMSSQPGGDMIVKILTMYPDLSADWLLRNRGKMLNNPSKENGENFSENSEKTPAQVSYDPQIGTPYYDVDFLGGFNEIFNNQTAVPACNVLVPGFEKASVWCNVTGHSMEPKINHGDIIALHECSINDIQYGEIYAVVLDTIRTIKILRRGSTPDVLRYVPINKDFDEQEFDVSRIIRVFEVLGSIARFF
ncbi:MAG: S24 family peptidase [Bacteroidaceae bacterium]|nr:S24 family peptidase [Bacteroidaceae bacterium]